MNTRDHAIQAIIALYRTGQSYSRVARKMGIGSETVRYVMQTEAPEFIRSSMAAQIEARQRNTNPHEISLGTLGLYRIGPCASCKVEMVSQTRETSQTCGLCLEYAARAA